VTNTPAYYTLVLIMIAKFFSTDLRYLHKTIESYHETSQTVNFDKLLSFP